MAIHVGTLHEYIVDCREYNEKLERRLYDIYDYPDNKWAVVNVKPWKRFEGSAIVTVRLHICTDEVEREIISALANFDE